MASVLASENIRAESLSALFDSTRTSEPAYLSARTNLAASNARKEQAFAALMPQVTASGNMSRNNRESDTASSFFSSGPSEEHYNARSAQVNITQPVLRYASFASLRQAEAGVAQAGYQLQAAEQELLSKLVAAWLDMLAARDNIELTRKQSLAAQRQWEMLRRGADLGSSSLPQVEEARAKYDQALAEMMSAESERDLKLAALEQLTGPLRDERFPFLRDGAILADMHLDTLENWLARLDELSPNILAAQQALQAAGAEVKKQYGGYLPTLDIVGNYSVNKQGAGNDPGQSGYDSRQSSIGLQLSVPIFTSGAQSEKVKEAVAMHERARLEVEAARRAAVFNAKQAWFTWHGANAKARAARQGIGSATLALTAAKVGVAKGLRTELDVLQAEHQILFARRDWLKANYDQIAAYAKLKAALGGLGRADMAAIDALFAPIDLAQR